MVQIIKLWFRIRGLFGMTFPHSFPKGGYLLAEELDKKTTLRFKLLCFILVFIIFNTYGRHIPCQNWL